jgi:lipopolysaccharide assembly protein B
MIVWLDWMIYLAVACLGGLAGWLIHEFLKGGNIFKSSSSSLGPAITALGSDDRDSAMDLLTQVVAENTDELHAYLTLGILYRRKGWFNRAVDMHRRLLSRTNIDEEFRYRTTIELALDFEEAGLLDRAISMVKDAIKLPHAKSEDYSLLGRLYETTGEWNLAVDAWRRTGDGSIWRQPVAFIIAMNGIHSRTEGDIRGAIKQFRHALKIDPKNPAALLGYAEIKAEQEKLPKAVELYETLQETRPDLTGVIADSIEHIMKKTTSPKLEAFHVELMQAQRDKPRVATRYAAYLTECDRKEEAADILKQLDHSNLSPEMLLRLVETAEKVGFQQLALDVSRKTLDKVISRDRFVCHLCGESIPLLVWRCPKCRAWGSIKSPTDFEFTSEEGVNR